jgi:hypothetical protein
MIADIGLRELGIDATRQLVAEWRQCESSRSRCPPIGGMLPDARGWRLGYLLKDAHSTNSLPRFAQLPSRVFLSPRSRRRRGRLRPPHFRRC